MKMRKLEKETIRDLDRPGLSEQELKLAVGGTWVKVTLAITGYILGLATGVSDTCGCVPPSNDCPSTACPKTFTCGCITYPGFCQK